MKMKLNGGILVLCAVLASGFHAVRAQQNGGRSASGFSSVEYFDAPNERQMKTRLSGAEAQPLAGGLLVIKQLKLETFYADGKPEWVVDAPECVYDVSKGTANSPGHLQFSNGDGKFHVAGDGFLWRRDDAFLTISNNVKTIIKPRP
jgi:hypothetical protein